MLDLFFLVWETIDVVLLVKSFVNKIGKCLITRNNNHISDILTTKEWKTAV